MNIKKILMYFPIILLLFSVITCKKKDLQEEKNAAPALVNKGNTVVYKDPQTSEPLDLKLSEWEEIICLNPEAPVTVEVTDEQTKEITKKLFYKIHKVEKDKIGWIAKEDMLFRESEPKEAIVVLPDCYLFAEPKEKKGIEKIPFGEKVNYLGYSLPYDYPGWRLVTFMRVKLVEKFYWVISDYVITDAYLGVMLEDAKLYKRPNDIPENLEKEEYKKMDLVPVLDKGDNGWIKVIKGGKTREFYILAKTSTPISYKEADYYITKHCKNAYINAKAIVDQVNKAYENSNSDDEVAKIPDKAGKIKDLNDARDIFKAKLFDYPETTFKDEFNKLMVAMDEVKIIFEGELKTENTETTGESDILPMDIE